MSARLLAAVLCFVISRGVVMSAPDPDEVCRLLPLPKWQKAGADSRLTTQRLIQLLRQDTRDRLHGGCGSVSPGWRPVL